jgi:hypothetical protein
LIELQLEEGHIGSIVNFSYRFKKMKEEEIIWSLNPARIKAMPDS